MNSSWLSDNRSKFWPFEYGEIDRPVSGSPTVASLPRSSVVDLCVSVSLAIAGSRRPVLRLVRTGVDAGNAIFVFREEFSDAVCTFSHSIAEWTPGTFPAVAPTGIGFSGFILLGDPAEFVARFSGLTAVAAPGEGCRVEPTTVRLDNRRVRRIRVASAERTLAGPPQGCGDPPAARPLREDVASSPELVGPIVLVPGRNARLSYTVTGVVVAASKGGGTGEPCDDYVRYGDETLQANGTYDGADRCSDVVRSISGVGGPHFRLTGGPGVDISTVPGDNRVVVDVSFNGLDSCGE